MSTSPRRYMSLWPIDDRSERPRSWYKSFPICSSGALLRQRFGAVLAEGVTAFLTPLKALRAAKPSPAVRDICHEMRQITCHALQFCRTTSKATAILSQASLLVRSSSTASGRRPTTSILFSSMRSVIAGSVPLGLGRGRRWRPAPTRRANSRSEARLGADSCTRCVNEELSRVRMGLGRDGIILHRYGKSMAAWR
jgi:hypothetical protein